MKIEFSLNKVNNDDLITLGHGSGALLTRKLIREVFSAEFDLPSLDDSVCLENSYGTDQHNDKGFHNRTVVTTDAYVIKPLFFPGGDIGKLSVTGTVNDLSMSGCKPAYLLAAFVIEEGFRIADLHKIVHSMQETALAADVKIIAGDTKVVEKGKCDGVYITTTGIGFLNSNINLTAANISVDDYIVINGTLGDHTAAVVNIREKLELTPPPVSDCASLYETVQILLHSCNLKFARDITRGGLATILNEIYEETGKGIIIEQELIPIRSSIKAFCELLGLDPLYMANEGKLVAFINQPDALLMNRLQQHQYSKEAAVIGKVTREVKGVYLKTSLGTLRPLPMLSSDPLPRIC